MQKFTRPITREIEVGGERLALTFSEQGIAVRPVGSRKPPKEITWAGVLTHMVDPSAGTPPSPEQLSAAVEQLRGPGAKPAPKPEPQREARSQSPQPQQEARSQTPQAQPAPPAPQRAEPKAAAFSDANTVMPGAQPVVPAGFESRWSAVR